MRLNYVIMLENYVWVAHCLEYNVVSHGQTPYDALTNLHTVLAAYQELTTEETVRRLPPAHGAAWVAYQEARALNRSVNPIEELKFNRTNEPFYGHFDVF